MKTPAASPPALRGCPAALPGQNDPVFLFQREWREKPWKPFLYTFVYAGMGLLIPSVAINWAMNKNK